MGPLLCQSSFGARWNLSQMFLFPYWAWLPENTNKRLVSAHRLKTKHHKLTDATPCFQLKHTESKLFWLKCSVNVVNGLNFFFFKKRLCLTFNELCIKHCVLINMFVWSCYSLLSSHHFCMGCLHKVGAKWINGWDSAVPTAQSWGLCLWLMCSCLGWQCQREWCVGMSATAACWITGFLSHWCKVNLHGRSVAPTRTLASFNPHPSGQASTMQDNIGI